MSDDSGMFICVIFWGSCVFGLSLYISYGIFTYDPSLTLLSGYQILLKIIAVICFPILFIIGMIPMAIGVCVDGM